jgi:2-oxoglutarate dehydrogenase E2 component (dihydrolipoamide succinyltransferase)
MFEVKVPRLAESISEGTLVAWLKQDGEAVKVDEAIATLETDKAAVEIPAEQAGVLHHAKKVGETVEVGDVIATIDANGSGPAPAKAKAEAAAPASAPAAAPATPAKAEPSAPPAAPAPASVAPQATPSPAEAPPLSPSVRRMIDEHKLDATQIPASGRSGRLLKEDVEKYLGERAQTAQPVPAAATPAPAAAPAPTSAAASTAKPGTQGAEWRDGEEERLVPMSRIRQRTAERLVQAQQTAAILTTFNEVDMTAVMDLRARFKEGFEKRHGVRLSFMSFFGRACTLALEQIPEINAEVRATNLAYHRHVHLGIAVGTERGLVVPVVRNADTLTFPQLEREIARVATLARDNKLMLQDLQGGTFSITNGGVYGSLLSTPILNPPQSGILGMHKIEKRPIVIDDQIVIRPMMYLALSYDHRIVDGEQAVTFLVRVKERLEDPERMLLDV